MNHTTQAQGRDRVGSRAARALTWCREYLNDNDKALGSLGEIMIPLFLRDVLRDSSQKVNVALAGREADPMNQFRGLALIYLRFAFYARLT